MIWLLATVLLWVKAYWPITALAACPVVKLAQFARGAHTNSAQARKPFIKDPENS
jgi:hypothetical protein